MSGPLAGSALASGAVSRWDWLTFATGVVLSLLGVVVAIVVALRQRTSERRRSAEERAAQHERDVALRRERDELASKIARRESWRIQYEKIDGLLDQLGDVGYQVRKQGPYTACGLARLELEGARMRAERLSDCGVRALREPLLRLAVDADQLLLAALEDGAVSEVPNFQDACRLAIMQDRAARELLEHITFTREVLHQEWGGR